MFRRCEVWPRTTGAHPINSARTMSGATCSTYVSVGWGAVPSKPLISGSASCTAGRWSATGRCLGKKDSSAPSEAAAAGPVRCPGPPPSRRRQEPRPQGVLHADVRLRISEAATLEVTAIDTAHGVLRVIGKGDKERRVPLPEPVLNDLSRTCRHRRHPRWLFPNRAATAPLSTGLLVRTFAPAARTAGLDDPRRPSPHTLR